MMSCELKFASEGRGVGGMYLYVFVSCISISKSLCWPTFAFIAGRYEQKRNQHAIHAGVTLMVVSKRLPQEPFMQLSRELFPLSAALLSLSQHRKLEVS